MNESTTAVDAEAARLRGQLAQVLADQLVLPDLGWRKAVEAVPRHRFVPGFYLPAEHRSGAGLTVWEPVTERTNPQRWLAAAYSDETLITQFDGDEPDWDHPTARDGGAPSSSSTLPSLVVQMWAEADVRDGQAVLEIGTGTGYSTALGCERFGSDAITSIEIDRHRLHQAAEALHSCGYTPDLAIADGLYGYWPCAPYDRVVAGCSVRAVPPAWLAQTRPGGKILTTLGGWLYGYARVLLTVGRDGLGTGPLLPGCVSFMAARTHEAPTLGNPTHWSSLHRDNPRPARHAPEQITAATDEGFFVRFLAQCAVPNAQMATLRDDVHLVDVVSGSVATLTRDGEIWQARQTGPVRLWDAVEATLDDYDNAGRPGPDAFELRVDHQGQRLIHPKMHPLALAPT